MLGIIPSSKHTYEVIGTTEITNPIEGKIYYDKNDNRLYYYSKSYHRSCPSNGFFPIWNGEKYIITKYSNNKHLSDVINTDINTLSSKINKTVANDVLYKHMSSDSGSKILKPQITNEDNMFTQCIKGVISNKNITIVDLFELAKPKLNEKIIDNYYHTLNKISFMRYDKWTVWINDILHLSYKIKIYKSNKKVLVYEYPSNKFNTGIIKYDKIVESINDPLKSIVKILIVIFNIDKSIMRKECNDDYTVNNLMTTINSDKPLSSQLFSRFLMMNKFNYKLELYEDNNLIFTFKE